MRFFRIFLDIQISVIWYSLGSVVYSSEIQSMWSLWTESAPKFNGFC